MTLLFPQGVALTVKEKDVPLKWSLTVTRQDSVQVCPSQPVDPSR